jgi:hypothetical protein
MEIEYKQLTDAVDRGDITFIRRKISGENPFDIKMNDFGLIEYARVHRHYDILSVLCDALNRYPMETRTPVYYRLLRNETILLVDKRFLETKKISADAVRLFSLLIDKSDLNSLIASTPILTIVANMPFYLLILLLFSGKLELRNYSKMLVVSCFTTDSDLVKKLLEHTDVIDFNYYEIHPQVSFVIISCVSICSTKNNYNILKIILDVAGKRVNAGIGNNYSFYGACSRGAVGIVKLLLKRDDVDPASTIIGGGGMAVACTRNRIEIVKLLLADGRALPSQSTLESICEKKYIKLLKLLFDFGFIPTIQMLISAVENSDYDVTKLLIQDARLVISEYNEVNEINDSYEKLLRTSVKRKNFEIIKMVYDDPRINPNYKNIATHSAILNDNRELFLYLYHHPRVDLTLDNYAIEFTISKNDWFSFNMLLDYKTSDGRQIDPSIDHNRALTAAIRTFISSRQRDIPLRMINRLLKDPRVNPMDSGNEEVGIPSALEQALNARIYQVVTLLLTDPRVRFYDLPGKLTNAIEQNDVELVQFLITLPNVEITKENLRRAFQLANDIQDNSIATLLAHNFDFYNNPMDEYQDLIDHVLSDLKPLVLQKHSEQLEKAQGEQLLARIRHDELVAKKQAEELKYAEQVKRVALLQRPNSQFKKPTRPIHHLVSRHKPGMLHNKKISRQSRRK